jgi:hypothetical protein
MIKPGRRAFLASGTMALGSAAACAMPGVKPSPMQSAPAPTTGSQSAVIGWEICDIDNNGADMFFVVNNAMTLNSVNIDISFVPTTLPTTGQGGVAEVLCGGSVSRGGPPAFNAGAQSYSVSAPSANFGSTNTYKGNSSLVIDVPPNVAQDGFCAVILKTWLPIDGAASATSRQYLANPSLALNQNDYLVFHMDHSGCGPGDVEMQIVLQYTLA